jgi:hypothetical protein
MIHILAIIALLLTPAAYPSRGGVFISGESGVVDPSATPEEELDRLIDGGIKTYNYLVRMNDNEAFSLGGVRSNRSGELKLIIEASRPETIYLTVATKPEGSHVMMSFLAQKKSSNKTLARTIIKLSLTDPRPAVIDRLFDRLRSFGAKTDRYVPITLQSFHEGPLPSFEDMAHLAVLIALRAYQPDSAKAAVLTTEYRRVLYEFFRKLEGL